MNYNEFLTKKKIDLTLFERSEPVLSAEFRSDFEQMGEKSFDHSKKFWFNKLRRAYHLKEAPKPPKVVIEKTEIASQAELLQSPTIEQQPDAVSGFVAPAARSVNAIAEGNTAADHAMPAHLSPAKAPGFKPRFKPGITSPPEKKTEDAPPPDTSSETARATDPVTNKAPAGFKPRFKAGVTGEKKTEDILENSTAQADPVVSNAPAGFKPRFKPGITGSAEKKTEEAAPPDTSSETTPVADSAATKAPAGFKPRFRAGVTGAPKNLPGGDDEKNPTGSGLLE